MGNQSKCRTSQSFVVQLKQAPVCLVCSGKRDTKQSLTICSHFRQSLQEGFLKSRLAQWSSDLSKLFSQWCFFPFYCCIVQPSPPLHLSVYLPHAVLLILLCWFSFSLCGAFVLSRRFVPWKPRGSCITTDASLRHGCGKSRVNSNRPDLSLIWQQCKGTSVFSVNVAEQRRCRLRQYFCSYKKQLITSGMKCLLPLFLTKLNNTRIVTNDLSSSESHQGRAQSKYRMNRQLHQWD